MSFRVKAAFVSHAGLPSGLKSAEDYSDYMWDVEREIESLKSDWEAYCHAQDASASDIARYESTVAWLEELRDEVGTQRTSNPE